MKRIAKLTRNADDTWTVRVGGQVEHIDTRGKTKAEVFEGIRWALISKEVSLKNIDLIELIRKAENR